MAALKESGHLWLYEGAKGIDVGFASYSVLILGKMRISY
jgi:hypothetical protein